MNKQIIRFFAVLSLCYATNTLSAATPVLPTGTWLFTTQIQLQLIPKTGSATLSLPTVIKGHDRAGPNCLNRHYQFISEYLSFY